MKSLVFPNEAAIHLALSELLPTEVQQQGGEVHHDGEAIWVTPKRRLAKSLLNSLKEAGITQSASPSQGKPFAHWGELLRPIPTPDADFGEVLFLMQGPWMPMAGELLRLGCTDQHLTRIEGQWAIRASAPPFYSIAKAVEGSRLQVFWPQAARVWVAVGSGHPAATALQVPESTLVLIDAQGQFRSIALPEWQPVGDHLDLIIPEATPTHEVVDIPRLQVPLRLHPRSNTGEPTLWCLAHEPDAILEQLLISLPESSIDQLDFARLTIGGVEAALLRTRPGRKPLRLDLENPCTPHPHLPRLFLPNGTSLEPPLQPSTLASMMDPGANRLAWLKGGLDRSFSIHQVDEAWFHPLADFTEYLADQSLDQIEAWMGSATFKWKPLPRPTPVHHSPAPARPERPEPQARVEEKPEAPARRSKTSPKRVRTKQADVVTITPSEAQVALTALQDQWRQDPSLDDLWPEMAQLHNAMGESHDAALCWVRAIWQAPDQAPELLSRWRATAVSPLPDSPTRKVLFGVVHQVLGGDWPDALPALQRWLDTHDAALDVRSRWLIRRAVAVASGDPLALARGRDLVLGSIRNGMDPSRDVPRFLRSNTASVDREQLGGLLESMGNELARLAPKSASRVASIAYGRLTIAWAVAHLGLAEQATQLLQRAALPDNDPIHAALAAQYRARVQLVLRGQPDEVPVPPDVTAVLDALPRFDRYKVDRLITGSVVLGASGARDPFAAFVAGDSEEPLPLDGAALVKHIEARLPEATGTEDWMRITRAMSALDPSQSSELLSRAVKAAGGLGDLEGARVDGALLSLIAVFRRNDLAPGMLQRLADRWRDLGGSVADAVGNTPRSLVRLQLKDEGLEAFLALLKDCPPDDATTQVILSAAAAQCGHHQIDDALSVAMKRLSKKMPLAERLSLAQAVAQLATPLPTERAMSIWVGLMPQFALMEDTYSTSSHFGLPLLRLVESICAATVHPDRLLDEEGRRLLEGEEQFVRQRIQMEGSL